jgi:hypothetical protein
VVYAGRERNDIGGVRRFEFGGRGCKLPPVPVVGDKRDEDLALGVLCDIVEKERALALLGAHLADGEQAGETAVGLAVARQAQEAQVLLQIEPRADDELQPDLLGGGVRAHDARKRIAVRDGERGKPQRLRLRDELLSVRGPAQEREVGRDLQLGVRRHARCHFVL